MSGVTILETGQRRTMIPTMRVEFVTGSQTIVAATSTFITCLKRGEWQLAALLLTPPIAAD